MRKTSKAKKSLLIFVSHSPGYIPLTVESYVKELSKYFTDTIMTTNLKIHLELPYKIIYFPNRGYDHGPFYGVLESINIEKYDRIAFVNDSNSLVGSFKEIFKWAETCKLDCWGLTDSVEQLPTNPRKNPYHIQSHFRVFEKKAINHLLPFFEKIKFQQKIMPMKMPQLREAVILWCEYGLTNYLVHHNLKVGARFPVKQWGAPGDTFGHIKIINPHLHKWEELIKMGYPLIKNKIIRGEWDSLIKQPENIKKYYEYK